MQRLAGGEWFTSRISCCGLLPVAHRVSIQESEHQELRGLYRVLSQDDTPMVRRAAAQNLSGMAETVEQQVLSQEICPIFIKLTQDGKYSHWPQQRKCCVQACFTLTDVMTQIKTLCACWLCNAAALWRAP